VLAVAAIVFLTYRANRPAPPAPQPMVALTPRSEPTNAPPPDTAPPAPVERVAPAAPSPIAPIAPAAPAAAPPAPMSAGSLALEDVLTQVMPAVVLVETSAGRGTAFFVRSDTLVTNVHVVGSSSTVTIKRADGSTMSARVESQASAYDLALLKISNPVATQPLIALGTMNSIRVGQEVIAIGSALGTLQNTVTRGIVSAVRRAGDVTLIQTDAAINPGNSGGPLLDRNGNVIGITTMGFTDRQGLNFAVGVDHARALLDGHATASSSASPATALTNELRNIESTGASDTDRMRSDGQRAYEQALAALAQRATAFDEEWQRFRSQCYSGAVTGSFDREWFALLSPRSLPGTVAPRCTDYLTDFRREATTFGDSVTRANDAARRSGVYPGVIRDTLRKYHLDYDAWSR